MWVYLLIVQVSIGFQIATLFVGVMCFFLVSYTLHCTWVTSEAYSSPSIVLSARSHDGSRIIFDDFREAYYWLRMNTPEVNFSFICAFVTCFYHKRITGALRILWQKYMGNDSWSTDPKVNTSITSIELN